MGRVRLARWLRKLANRWDPPPPTPTPRTEGEAVVSQQPLSEIRVVHSSIGTQANRSRKRSEQTAWRNRR